MDIAAIVQRQHLLIQILFLIGLYLSNYYVIAVPC